MKMCDSILAEKYNEVLGYKMLVEKPFGFFDKVGAKIGSAFGSQSSAAKLDAGNLLNRYYQSFKEYLIKANLNTNTVTNVIFKNYFKKSFTNVENSPTWRSIPIKGKYANQPVVDIEEKFKKIIGEWNLYKDDASYQTPNDSNLIKQQEPATPATPATQASGGGGGGSSGGGGGGGTPGGNNLSNIINFNLAPGEVLAALNARDSNSLIKDIQKLSPEELNKLKSAIDDAINKISNSKSSQPPSEQVDMATIQARQGNTPNSPQAGKPRTGQAGRPRAGQAGKPRAGQGGTTK